MVKMFRKGQHAVSKIVCLALGLAISSVIIAEIYFEQTFDSHFKGADRTYEVLEKWKTGDMKDMVSTESTPGAWAPGLKRYAPMVEAYTRLTGLQGSSTQMRLDDNTVFKSSLSMADSCFFDVFPQRILAGNPKEILSRENCVMVSSDLAKVIGGNVVGRRVTVDSRPDITLTICGVYEAFPWGSSLHGQSMLLSLNSIGEFGYDGRDNWLGNEQYRSYIRLASGHRPEELLSYARKAIADNVDKSLFQKAGVEVAMDFQLLNEVYTSAPYIKMMKWILSIVAFVMLFISVMNYLLIVIGNMVGRSREMAVRKCYGAGPKDIYGLIFREAAVDVGLAIVLATLLVFACKGSIEELLSAPVTVLLFNRGAWIIAAVVGLVLFIGGIVPAWLYNRTPVTAAFRSYNENRRRWKLALLAAEFAIVGLMLSLLWIISSQYSKIMNINVGYDFKNVAMVNIQGIKGSQRQQCLTELSRLPEVKEVSSALHLPLEGWYGAGNNVSLPGEDRELFNAEDFYQVSDNFFHLMGIRIVDGTFFTDRSDSCRQVMVDENFERKLRATAHWKGSVVGRRIWVSEHCETPAQSLTIVGVFNNIQLGGVNHSMDEDLSRPVMIFYSETPQTTLLLKLSRMTPDVMNNIRQKAEALFPGKEVSVLSYATEYGDQYISQRNFRNGILAGGIVVLVIALFGLVGYISDEVQRRSKEIAIRKVNGARVSDILRLFLADIIRIAVPGIVVGDIGAWFIAGLWLQNFTVRIPLTVWPFLAVTVIILLIITASVTINCWRTANSNPVKYLKDE